PSPAARMKPTVVLLALVGVAVAAKLDGLAHQHDNQQHNIDDRHSRVNRTGERFTVVAESIRHSEYATSPTKDKPATVTGSYSWTAPNGETFLVEYEADERGFRPVIHRGNSASSVGSSSGFSAASGSSQGSGSRSEGFSAASGSSQGSGSRSEGFSAASGSSEGSGSESASYSAASGSSQGSGSRSTGFSAASGSSQGSGSRSTGFSAATGSSKSSGSDSTEFTVSRGSGSGSTDSSTSSGTISESVGFSTASGGSGSGSASFSSGNKLSGPTTSQKVSLNLQGGVPRRAGPSATGVSATAKGSGSSSRLSSPTGSGSGSSSDQVDDVPGILDGQGVPEVVTPGQVA
ncbi:hypothetical protein OTU49_003932, partial [Cherax quadricarinatus]